MLCSTFLHELAVYKKYKRSLSNRHWGYLSKTYGLMFIDDMNQDEQAKHFSLPRVYK